MSTSRYLVTFLAAFSTGAWCADESPDLGEPVGSDTLGRIDYTVLPNGDGLPAGSGTAKEGGQVYRAHCIACHGEGGRGGTNDALAGGHGSLADESPTKTVGSYWPYATTVFDYVRRAMPFQAPGTLTDVEVYAVTAYLLHINEIIDEDFRIDAESLPNVKMPNEAGFRWAYSP
jgi:cytochrome c